MIKVIRVPITDIYGQCLMTGQKVDLSQQKKELAEKFNKKMQVVSDRILSTKRSDGKVYVEGLGWC